MTRETEGARGFREGCALWRTGWGAATERYGHGECGWGARTASLLNAVVQFEDKWRGETTTRARGGEMKARICRGGCRGGFLHGKSAIDVEEMAGEGDFRPDGAT